ncbi:MAG: hypothetical protein WDM91_11170 [Rhizomicrobium sp.]
MTDRLSIKNLDAPTLQRLHDALLNQGLLIEAGWVSLRIAAIPPDAPEVQLEEMRNAFFAGAKHLFSSIMIVLDPGSEEPTAADMARMDKIQRELDAYIQTFALRRLPTEGCA